MEATEVLDLISLGIISIGGTFGNLLILAAFIADKSLRTISNVFIINVAIGDLCITMFSTPIMMVNVYYSYDYFNNTVLCYIVGMLLTLLCGVTINTLALLAINRYLNICHTALGKKVFTKLHTGLMILCVWVYCILWILPTFFGWGRINYVAKVASCAYDHTYSLSYTLALMSVGVGLPIVVTFVCYTKTFLKIRASARSVESHNKNVDKTKSKRHERQVIAFVIVSGLFVIFWTPYATVVIADYSGTLSIHIIRFVVRFGVSNSAINCIVYGLINKNIRNGYLKALCYFNKGHSNEGDRNVQTSEQTST